MPLPHMAEGKAWAEQMCSGAFQFVVPALSTTANYQVRAALLTAAQAPTPQLTPTSTMSPINARVQVYCSPNGSVAGATGNPTPLPKGMSPGAISPAGSEFLIDFSGFPADIVNETANFVGVARGAGTTSVSVSCIDNVNKLVYLQGVNTTSGAAVALPANSIVACQIVFQDTYAV